MREDHMYLLFTYNENSCYEIMRFYGRFGERYCLQVQSFLTIHGVTNLETIILIFSALRI
jgi:hypothetical protein